MKKMTNKEVNEYIKAHCLSKSDEQMSQLLGLSPSAVRGRRRRMGLIKDGENQYNLYKPLKTVEESIRELVKKKKQVSLEQLSDQLDVGIGRIRRAVETLNGQGYNIHVTGLDVSLSSVVPQLEPVKIFIPSKVDVKRFGATGDNHLGSKYERLDVLNALYDLYEKEGITVVYNTGNIIDGEARFNKFDIHVYGMDAQIDWFVSKYPQRKGITTYFITGDDHEGWYVQREGVNIGAYIQMKAKEAGRNDLVWIGHMENDIHIPAKDGFTTLRVQHPGGGTAYAISYTAQKIVESYQGGEKPDILLLGHYHKAEYGYPREVHVVQTGTTCDQTPFMRKKKIQAHVGGWVVEFQQGDDGSVVRFKSEWIPFFNRDYYKRWSYKH